MNKKKIIREKNPKRFSLTDSGEKSFVFHTHQDQRFHISVMNLQNLEFY